MCQQREPDEACAAAPLHESSGRAEPIDETDEVLTERVPTAAQLVAVPHRDAAVGDGLPAGWDAVHEACLSPRIAASVAGRRAALVDNNSLPIASCLAESGHARTS